MAHTVTWSEYAERDLQKIAAYISKDSVPNAVGVITEIATAARRLADFPYSGRIIPEVGKPTAREILIFDYRIMYQILDEVVDIRMVMHTRRSFGPERLKRRFK